MNFASYIYTKNETKAKLQSLFEKNEIQELLKQTTVWMKNVFNRVVLVWFFTFLFFTAFIASVILLGVGSHVYVQTKNMHLIIGGIILALLSIFLPIVFYYADSWNVPCLYQWKLILQKLQPFFYKHDLSLPFSVAYLYDINFQKSQRFSLLRLTSITKIPKKYKKYLISQLKAKMDFIDQKIPKTELQITWTNLYQYWGNLQVIWEFACFLKGFCLFYLDEKTLW